MKFLENNKGEINPILLIGVLLVVAVLAWTAYSAGAGADEGDGGADVEPAPDADVIVATGTEYSGDLELTLQDWTGTAVATASNVDAILTVQGVYADANEAYDALQKEGSLESPFGTTTAPVASVTDGVVTFSGVTGDVAGTQYALFIYDPDTTTGTNNFNALFGDITIKGSYSEYNDAESVKVMKDERSLFQSKTITMTERGTLAFVDSSTGDETVNTLTRDMEADAVLDDESMTFSVLTTNDNSKVEEMSFFIGELDDVVGEMDLTIEKVFVGGVPCDFTKMADVDDDVVEANEPAISGADTVYYIELAEGVEDSLTRVNDNNKETVDVKIVFDADSTGATINAAGGIKLAMVPSSGAEETVGISATLGSFVIGETEATVGWSTV